MRSEHYKRFMEAAEEKRKSRGMSVRGVLNQFIASTPSGVRVIYDIESESRRTVQYETRLGCWDSYGVYRIRGMTFGVKFTEEEITADGLVQYVHLEQVDQSNAVIPTGEQLIDELLANGWSLADG